MSTTDKGLETFLAYMAAIRKTPDEDPKGSIMDFVVYATGHNNNYAGETIRGLVAKNGWFFAGLSKYQFPGARQKEQYVLARKDYAVLAAMMTSESAKKFCKENMEYLLEFESMLPEDKPIESDGGGGKKRKRDDVYTEIIKEQNTNIESMKKKNASLCQELAEVNEMLKREKVLFEEYREKMEKEAVEARMQREAPNPEVMTFLERCYPDNGDDVSKIAEIYKLYPPLRADAKFERSVGFSWFKKMIQKALLHYHPDHQHKGGPGHQKICIEITKLLNHFSSRNK
jgi:hypothetical protein